MNVPRLCKTISMPNKNDTFSFDGFMKYFKDVSAYFNIYNS